MQHKSAFFEHKLAVKLDNSLVSPIGKPSILPTSSSIWLLFEKLGISQHSPLFGTVFDAAGYGGKNGEAANNMRSADLHTWFIVTLPAGASLGKVWEVLQRQPGVVKAEPMPKFELTSIPNDSEFSQQWYLNNTGQAGGTSGVDVGIVQAWDIETGKSNVIIGITDGGVDTAHPDLRQNLWAGVGFNFVNPNMSLDRDGHATHVAGVTSATRNNGMGISGIAGGDGSIHSGARYMSLQIVGGGTGAPGSEAQSFVYAANNGVSVSQNSWGYSIPNTFPSYTQEAIDYFISKGGGQVMEGGIVIFAAGNSSTNQTYYPAAYQKVMAVAASNNKDILSYYSNYGDWIDIVAPGGDLTSGSGGGIRSTEAPQTYSFRQGTSMAAPVVSGIVALMLSKAPNRLRPDDLKYIIQQEAKNINAVNLPFLQGQLGAGRINANAIMQKVEALASQPYLPPPSSLAVSAAVNCGFVDLTWQKGDPNLQVVVAVSESGQFGLPFGKSYALGETIGGKDRVAYRGSASAVQIPLSVDGSTMNLRIWTWNAATNNYSLGRDVAYKVPATAFDITTIPGSGEIELNWKRRCPNRGILLAWNASPVFGKPAGDPKTISLINGGGNALQSGTQASFLHQNLTADRVYYYALYAYLEINGTYTYSDPQIVTSSTLCDVVALPISENFVTSLPGPKWRLIDGGASGGLQPDGRTWRKITGWSADGDNSTAVLPCYLENGNNSKEVLRSPLFTRPFNSTDSVVLQFSYAYRAYSEAATLADSLGVMLSFDCGATGTVLWQAGGTKLATVAGTQTSEFLPSDAQWKKMEFDLTGLVAPGQSANVLFVGTNRFGQNIWLDNITIQQRKQILSDVEVNAVTAQSFSCTDNHNLLINLKNRGTGMVNSTVINIRNSIVNQSVAFTDLQLQPGKETTLVYTVAGSAGNYATTVALATPDDKPANDTARVMLVYSGKTTLPYFTDFDNTAFVSTPDEWAQTRNGEPHWQINNLGTSSSGSSALAFDNMGSSTGTATALLPVMPFSAEADSVILEMDIAATSSSDDLLLTITGNCGQTVRQVVSLLPSNADPEYNGTTPFAPTPDHPWRHIRTDVAPWLRGLGSGTFQIMLRGEAKGGTKFYLDNLKLSEVRLPQALKDEGFGIYPVPVGSRFTIWHLQPPTDLQGVTVFNAAGQRIWQAQYGTNAPQTIFINSAAWAKGFYAIQLHYSDRIIVKKVVK